MRLPTTCCAATLLALIVTLSSHLLSIDHFFRDAGYDMNIFGCWKSQRDNTCLILTRLERHRQAREILCCSVPIAI